MPRAGGSRRRSGSDDDVTALAADYHIERDARPTPSRLAGPASTAPSKSYCVRTTITGPHAVRRMFPMAYGTV